MTPIFRFFSVAVLAAVIPTGCSTVIDDPALASAIKAHYAAHATEEDGVCSNPRIDSIQDRRLLGASDDGHQVMLVRYSYFDSHADMDERYDKLVSLSQPCGGIAERRFVLVDDGPRYRVAGMSGERRIGESRH